MSVSFVSYICLFQISKLITLATTVGSETTSLLWLDHIILFDAITSASSQYKCRRRLIPSRLESMKFLYFSVQFFCKHRRAPGKFVCFSIECSGELRVPCDSSGLFPNLIATDNGTSNRSSLGFLRKSSTFRRPSTLLMSRELRERVEQIKKFSTERSWSARFYKSCIQRS